MSATDYITHLLEAADAIWADPRQESAVRAGLAHDLAEGRIDQMRTAGVDLTEVDDLIDHLADGTYDQTPEEVAAELAGDVGRGDRGTTARLTVIVTASRILYPDLEEQDDQAAFLESHVRQYLTLRP